IGAFVWDEAAGEPDGKDVRVEDAVSFAGAEFGGIVEGLVERADTETVVIHGTAANIIDETFPGGITHIPDGFIGDVLYPSGERFRISLPAIFHRGARRTCPHGIGGLGFPSRRMYAVGDVRDRDFSGGPALEQWFEEMPADLAMEPADAIDATAAANGQISHIESFVRIVRVGAAEREEIADGNAQSFLRVVAEVPGEQRGVEMIESGSDGGVSGKEVAGAGDR